MKVMITGDRSTGPRAALVPVLVILGRELKKGEPFELVTGDLPGVEKTVKLAAHLLGIELSLDGNKLTHGDGAWETRAAIAKQYVDRVLFLHPDPHASRMLPPLIEEFGDVLEIVSPELMFA